MGRIVCLGDSLTWGFPYGPEASWTVRLGELTGYRVVNQGVNGDTTEDMLRRFSQDVLALRPDYLIVTGGANDIIWRESLDRIVANIEEMILLALEASIQPIIGLTPAVDYEEAEERLRRLRLRLRELASRYNLKVIDFSTPFYREDGSVNGDLFLDGAHPTRQGYALMAACLPDDLL